MLGGGSRGRTATFGKKSTIRRVDNSTARRQLQLWDELQQEENETPAVSSVPTILRPAQEVASNNIPTVECPVLVVDTPTIPQETPIRTLVDQQSSTEADVESVFISDLSAEHRVHLNSSIDNSSTPISSDDETENVQESNGAACSPNNIKALDDSLPLISKRGVVKMSRLIDDAVDSLEKLDIGQVESDTDTNVGGNENSGQVPAETDNSLAKLLALCGSTSPSPMQGFNFGGDLIKKIGEASYSDVYSMWMKTESGGKDLMAIKVIPVGQGDIGDQLSLEAVSLEIQITRAISKTRQTIGEMSGAHPNFVDMVYSSVCSGPYSDELLALWDEYDERKGSENIPPCDYNDTQLYVIMVLRHGGNDLEHSSLITTAARAKSLLLQVSLALAQAEQQMSFEHRDLHWGNVLIDKSPLHTMDYSLPTQSGNVIYSVPTAGIKATIIDFSLSRLELDSGVMFLDLEQDPDYFSGSGYGEEGMNIEYMIWL
ncbi:hypothetical protein BASA61_005365 [Batrachochytrium salamandrivorans]|nr:hypothetical protein BASA61_005365 [Batrachochytrium salamandrivorans]